MPGENIFDWSTTADDNDNADSIVQWIEGTQLRASLNDMSRSEMAALAKWRNLRNGSIVTGGTANAQTFASGMSFTGAPPTGMRVLLKIGAALTTTAIMTLNMDGIGAVTVKAHTGEDLKGDEVVAGGYGEFLFDGTNWILLTETRTSPR